MSTLLPSVRLRAPPGGIHLGGEAHVTHLSMSSLSSTARSSQDQWASYNRQQIYKKINEWFTDWRPWQQRMLLCGLTNRCSTSQLESLATTLEPLFHRDFVTSLRKRYPSAPFRKLKARQETDDDSNRNEMEEIVRKLTEEILESALAECARRHEHAPDDIAVEVDEAGNVQGVSFPVPQLPLNGAIQEENDIADEAEVDTTLAEGTITETAAEEADRVYQVDEPETGSVITETSDQPKSDGDKETKGGPGEGLDHIQEEDEEVIDEPQEEEEDEEDEEEEGEEELQFFKPRMPKFDEPRNIHISRPFLTSFEYAPKPLVEGSTGPLAYKDNLGLLLTRQHTSLTTEQHTRQSYPPVAPCSGVGSRVHRHRSGVATAEVKVADFFDKGRMSKLGPLQAQLRTGKVCRPSKIADLNAPVQKMYKHVKFWGNNPEDGKAFVRARKSHLKWHFREQVNRVYDWMADWEEYERLNLLVEIVKLCDHELLNFLVHCLIERLRERIDISWLSDPLLVLIFSYLPVADIDSCSRVCRRWRYLSSTNEIWMIKCQEFGLDQGIPDLLDLVRQSGHRGQSVDWRLAYLELQAITDQARASLPVPSRLAFQSSTPVGMKRVGGKFLPASEPASLRRSNGLQSGGSRLSSSSVFSAIRDSNTAVSVRKSILREPGVESVREQQASTRGPESSFPSRGVSRLLSAFSPVKSERLLRSRDGPRDSKVPSRRGRRRKEKGLQPENVPSTQGPLRKLRGRKKAGDEEEEVAVDMRPELIQAKDLLSKGATIPPRLWTAEDAKEARERLETYVVKAVPIKRVRKLQGHMDAVLCVEFDLRRLVSGSMDRSIRIWDIRSGRSLHKLLGHKGGVTCLCFDNDTLYSGSWDSAIMVWNMVNFERVQILTGHKGSISCLAMNDDYVFSGSHDGTVRAWRRSTLLCDHVSEDHASHVLSMALHGPHLVTGSSDKTIRITDFLTHHCIRIIRTTYPVDTLWVTGSLILTGNARGELYVLNKETGEAEVGIRAHEAAITRVNYYGGHIFTTSADATIKEWDLMTMTCVRCLQGHKGAVKDFKITSKAMVSAGADGHVRVWDKILPMFSMGDEQDNMRMEVVDHSKI